MIVSDNEIDCNIGFSSRTTTGSDGEQSGAVRKCRSGPQHVTTGFDSSHRPGVQPALGLFLVWGCRSPDPGGGGGGGGGPVPGPAPAGPPTSVHKEKYITFCRTQCVRTVHR